MVFAPSNAKDRQIHLLRRWAKSPEYSPLSRTPDLSDIIELSVDDDWDIEKTSAESRLVFLDYEAEQDEVLRRVEALQQQEEEIQKEKARKEEELLNNTEMAQRIQEWFLENFEPPTTGADFDEYIWGGPYDVRTVIGVFFDEHIGDDGEVLDTVVAELESLSPAWVPIGSKFEAAATGYVKPKTAEEAYQALQERLNALEQLLRQIPDQVPSIGHNFPPEPIDDTPVDRPDRELLLAAIRAIRAQPIAPEDRGDAAREAAIVIYSRAQKVRSWLARQGDNFTTEAIKEAGKQFGKWAPRALWLLVLEHMFSVTELVSHWISLISRSQ